MLQTIRIHIGRVNTFSHYSLMNNLGMDFRKWLQLELDSRGMAQAELARRSKVPQPTIQRILSGETPDPRGSTIEKIKRVLGAPPDTNQGPDIRGNVPLISWVQAGHWGDIIDSFQPEEAESWRETTARVSKHSFALRIVGDSMEPTIPQGSVVIVDPAIHADSGRIVVVRQNGDTEATIKRLVIEGGVRYLKPENPRYPIMEMSLDAVICGVAVKVELDL